MVLGLSLGLLKGQPVRGSCGGVGEECSVCGKDNVKR